MNSRASLALTDDLRHLANGRARLDPAHQRCHAAVPAGQAGVGAVVQERRSSLPSDGALSKSTRVGLSTWKLNNGAKDARPSRTRPSLSQHQNTQRHNSKECSCDHRQAAGRYGALAFLGTRMGWRSPKASASAMARSIFCMLVGSATCTQAAPALSPQLCRQLRREPTLNELQGLWQTLCARSTGSSAATAKQAHQAHCRTLQVRRGFLAMTHTQLTPAVCARVVEHVAGASRRQRTSAPSPRPAKTRGTARWRTGQSKQWHCGCIHRQLLWT